MTIATLSQVLEPANVGGYSVPGLVCLGWEDTRAYVAAAEAESAPVILQAGKLCRAHTPLSVLAAMFRTLAEGTDVQVVAHLDHGHSLDECRQALDCGFTSVMYDGSRLPLLENIVKTAEVANLAKGVGASCEGEIGSVGYPQGAASATTVPEEAAQFAQETGVDAMAVSVGNIHLQIRPGTPLDLARIRAIEALTEVPLVVHGGSGLTVSDRQNLSMTTRVAKINIGTELRMAFGQALRNAIAADPSRFDRIEILQAVQEPLTAAARQVFRQLGASGRA
ncbi:MAG: class II fructose-bisphosphate aldolase [Rhodobacteraceae bacterium]|nr:class II fructose-bisphosphate aldolase [Paracoccaceae bacterium]